MVTTDEALKSEDPNVVKRLRGSICTQITCDINLLNKELAKKTDTRFDIEKISHQLIKIQRKKLVDHFDLVQKLHDRFITIRVEGPDDESEEALVVADIEYMQKITLRVCPVLDELSLYDEALAEGIKLKNLTKNIEEANDQYTKAKKEFNLVFDKIMLEINKIESLESNSDARSAEINALPVDILVRNISTAFGEIKKSFNKLKEINRLTECNGNEAKATLDYETEHNKYIDVELKLKRFEQMRKPAAPASTDSSSKTVQAIPLKINKPDNLAYTGQARDFAAFKRDFLAIVVPNREASQIGIYFKQAIPEKHKYLIANKELHEWQEMMDIIEDELATPKIIIDQTVTELERMKTATSDRAFVDFVDSLEKICRDLTTLDQLGEVANTSILSKLEAKLPVQINHDWTSKVIKEKLAKKSSKEKFDQFMLFLKEAKEMTKYNLCLSGGGNKNLCFVTGTFRPQTQPQPEKEPRDNQSKGSTLPCLACNADGATDLTTCMHNMSTCLVWGSLSYHQRVGKVNCIKHPFSKDGHTSEECTRDINRPCLHCKGVNIHHSLLCPSFQVRKKSSTNTASSTYAVGSTMECARTESDLPQTLLYACFARTLGGKRLGTLIDNGSTDDYILNQTARKLKLMGQPVELITEGFGGVETHIQTQLYSVPVVDKKNRVHYLPCYGTDRITADSVLPETASYQKLCKKFNINPTEVPRPRRIELLISMRSGHLHPCEADSIVRGGMKLASGPLGKVFGGTCSDLMFNPTHLACPTTAVQIDNRPLSHSKCMKSVVRQAVYTTPLRTDKEILNFFNEEQIGVHCQPKCGGCKCGACVLGNKQMSLKDERDYERFRSLMYLDVAGTKEDPGPYWRTEYPWTIEPEDLIDNKAAVTAVMLATEKKLSRNPQWRKIYEDQLLALVDKRFAREITIDDINTWEKKGGKSYFIAHQMAVNPQSKTTPVRCCFNSSQRYQGHSLNSSWELGPDLVNSLHAVLLRFRKDSAAAQGDIAKMYYMVRITEKESWMQIFMWRFNDEKQIRYFKMERLVMGNKPSASLSGVALSETAKLGDFAIKFPSAHKALTTDAYVDNVFVTAENHVLLKAKIKEIELVAEQGGFYFKPFVISGEDIPDMVIGVAVPGAIGNNEEKALGLYWDVKDDRLYIKADLEKSSKNAKRGITKVNVLVDQLSNVVVTPHLTLRACLSLHARPFDPLGLVLPTRMIGNILFRNTLQIIKKDKKGKIPWDEVISGDLKEAWCKYFSMLTQLEDMSFPRSFKPDSVDLNIKPDFCTLNDGNPDAFGTVGYARWTLLDGTYSCRLMLSKSRLSPLSHKGETVRNELSGSTLSARLKNWVVGNSEVEFGNFYHFLDSQIVKDMMSKESYGFNTFVGLRVAEIQQKTSLSDWLHIPSKFNVSDILTKGVPPNLLGPGSDWQNGPSWLSLDQSAWPISPMTTKQSQESIIQMEQFFRKTKVLAMKTTTSDRLDQLIARSSTLSKLLRSVAYILRWLRPPLPSQGVPALPESAIQHTSILVTYIRPITASEKRDALDVIIAWEQKKLSNQQTLRLVPKVSKKKLINYDFEITQTVVGGRIKNFPVAFSGHCEEIPIVPYGDLAKLIVDHYHKRFHKEVDTIVAHVRNDFWVVKCRKIASSLDAKCIDCKLQRKHRAEQIMGELPEFRTSIQPAFSVVGVDLWGPIVIRDDVIKRGNRTTKKVWGVMFTCTATRAVYLDVACGLSTEELLHTIRRAMVRCGEIRTIISDPGTNFVGAARELKEWRDGWDNSMLVRFGAERSIEFITVMANSQHQNGISEIMIKLSKSVLKSLLKSLGEQVLSLNELNTLLAETTQLVNERPIGLKPNEKVDSSFLSPNSLLLGRSSERICSGPFMSRSQFSTDSQSFTNRFLLVQAITDQFWRNWHKLYYPSLVIRQKWHVERRNLQVGDVCVVRDSNALRGEWRLAKVTCCYPDRLGRVRNVELLMKPTQGGSTDYIPTPSVHVKRHVNNIVVLIPSEEQFNGSQVHTEETVNDPITSSRT